MKRKLVSLTAVTALMAAALSVVAPGALAAPEKAKDPTWNSGSLFYDLAGAEVAEGSNWTTDATNFAGFDGEGYVFLGNGAVEMNLNVPVAGNYEVTVRAAANNNGNRFDALYINENGYQMTLVSTTGYEWGTATVGTGEWVDGAYIAKPPANGIPLKAGSNIVRIHPDWGYCAYDSITLTPKFELSDGEELMMDIYTLPATVTLEDKATVTALQARYQALSKAEQAKVSNYDTLEAAAAAIAELERLEVQQPTVDGDTLTYEVEKGSLTGEASVKNTLVGFSGDGYVETGEGEGVQFSVSLRIFVPKAGKYDIAVSAAKLGEGNACDSLVVNGGDSLLVSVTGEQNQWTLCCAGTENWVEGVLQPTPAVVELSQGENILVFSKNWPQSAAYDKVVLTPHTEDENPGEGDNPGEGEKPTQPSELSAVQKVEQMISVLPSVIEQKDADAVNAAYAAYIQLTEAEQAQVHNVNKLRVSCARVRAIEAGDTQKNALRFEAESGTMNGNSAVVGADGAMKNYSGDGYVFLFDASFTVDVYVPQTGQYDLYVIGASDSGEDKSDYVSVNGGEKLLTSYLGSSKGTWVSCQPGTEDYLNEKLAPAAPENGFSLKAGKNTVEISANWGYSCYDAVVVVPRFDMVITDDLDNAVVNTGETVPALALTAFGAACVGLAIGLPKRRKNTGEFGE